MATVILNSDLARRFANGVTSVPVEAENVRQVIAALNARFPGIGAALATDMAVSIDGRIYPDPFMEAVAPDSEVCFLPAIAGG